MTPEKSEYDDARNDVQIGDFLAPLFGYRRLIWRATLAATLLAIVAGGLYYVAQPTRWSAFLEFRPIFKGASTGEYPNQLPFGVTDIIDPTVLDQVYDKNHIEQFCQREEFRAGFIVDETSTELQLLDLDYQVRLGDTRLSAADRERLQNEYRARRTALAVRYRLTWIRSKDCRAVPPAIATKALNEVLEGWANDAELRRGVLKLRVAVLTPAVFDVGTISQQSLLIRADLIRGALTRVIGNIGEIELLPGAELTRAGQSRISFAQLRARLEDLVQVHLDPLIAVAGRGQGNDAIHWTDEALAQAVVHQKAAEDRASAYSLALREYSGITNAPVTTGVQRPPNASDVQTLTPQIDRTFIDRIVDLSAANTAFRQELTRSLVVAKLAAVETTEKVAHYTQLLATLKTGSSSALSEADVTQRLTEIVTDGKEQVRQFGELYDEFSRASLRAGPAMYQLSRPAEIQVLKSFKLRSLALIVVGVLFATPIVLAIGCLLYHAFQRQTRRLRTVT